MPWLASILSKEYWSLNLKWFSKAKFIGGEPSGCDYIWRALSSSMNQSIDKIITEYILSRWSLVGRSRTLRVLCFWRVCLMSQYIHCHTLKHFSPFSSFPSSLICTPPPLFLLSLFTPFSSSYLTTMRREALLYVPLQSQWCRLT